MKLNSVGNDTSHGAGGAARAKQRHEEVSPCLTTDPSGQQAAPPLAQLLLLLGNVAVGQQQKTLS